MEPAKVAVCPVCSGDIVRTDEKVYVPRPGPMVFGPGNGGGKLPSYIKTKLWCDDCGISYAKLPKESA